MDTDTPTPPTAGDTMDMSQVAGPRDVPVTPDDTPAKAKKDKKKVEEMTAVGPSGGAVSAADQALAELGTKRGIETLFRTSYRVNMDLSSLADAKANIMISINGLIVSIMIASIAPGIEKNPWLLIPTSLFLLGCLISLVFAVLAARPRVQSSMVTPTQVLDQRKNLLFFGNFSHMSEMQFVDTLKEVVMDSTRTYEMMMKDIYGVGSVLQKKYEMLQRSYSAFLVALVVGVIGFIIVFTYAALFDPSGSSLPVAPVTPNAATGILP
ncbi:Pycsar system effector family protein [Rubrivirga sp. IMCC45206]|uniref:Pycsar system effector family protein n=1 Tax=Rubrivirga sp. IMCC45206 TaxID=3391614 RepID=UPI00398FD2FF